MDSEREERLASARVIQVCGPRSAERWVLERVRRQVAEVRRDPTRLAAPLEVVAPSARLREHLAAAVVRELGHGVAGVGFSTLEGLAHRLLQATQRPAPQGERLAGLLAERLARGSRPLERSLGELEGGLAEVRRTVHELVAAGFRPEHAPALLERIDDDRRPAGPRAARHRARALVELCAEVERTREALGAGGRPALFAAALEVLSRGEGPALDRHLVLAFGEERGLSLDLIEGLARRGATVVVEGEPEDAPQPSAPAQSPAQERLAAHATARSAAAPAAQFEAVLCTDPEAEARAAVERAAEAIAAGTPPERIALVARDLGELGPWIAVHARRLGLPFHGAATDGPRDPALAPLRALLEVAALGSSAPLTRWLEALDGPRWLAAAGALPRLDRWSDLRTGLASLGLARLSELQQLDVDARLGGAQSLPLPVRRGATAAGPQREQTEERASDTDPEEEAGDAEDVGGEGGPRGSVRRQLPRGVLEAAAAEAARLLADLEHWPTAAPVREHRRSTVRLVRERLLWPAEGPLAEALERGCAALEEGLPPDFPVEPQEWFALLTEELERRGRLPFGGRGAGVAVLGADGARGLAFDLLLWLGLERDQFPRLGREDALLPDRVRERLREVLPDLETTQERSAAEWRLFRSLSRSAPRIWLARASQDVEGKPRAPSALLLRLGADLSAPQQLPSLYSPRSAPTGPRPAYEHLLAAGLRGADDGRGELLALALAEGQGRSDPSPTDRTVAAARRQTLDWLDALPHTGATGPGPYGGWSGAPPRPQRIFTTRLEALVRCAWQAHLLHGLHLEPTPDPLSRLPQVDALTVGLAVHRTLETWIESQRPGASRPQNLVQGRARGALAVGPPTPRQLEALLREAVRLTAAEQGLVLPGLVRVLLERARPLVERALELEWPAGTVRQVLGAELEGELSTEDAAGRPVEIAFRADRADLLESGLRLVDYKTGKPPHDQQRVETRRKHVLADVVRGQRLQAAAYALATGGEGLYVYLGDHAEELAAEVRLVRFEATEGDLASSFHGAVGTVLAALEVGAAPPRWVNAKGQEPGACGYCTVAEACLRGDSGARGRSLAFLERQRSAPAADGDGAARAWFELFELAHGPRATGEEEQ